MNLMDQIVLTGVDASPEDPAYAFASYVYRHFDEVADLTIEELAQECSLSPATISRLVRKMGLPGYRQFREQCARLRDSYHASEVGHDHFRLAPDNVLETLTRSLGPAAARVTDTQLDLFLSYLLRDGGASYVVGLANMHALAMSIQFAVSAYRGYTIFAPSNFREIVRATRNDTVIALSSTGNVFRDTDLTEHLQACGTRRLLVTTSNLDPTGLPVHDVIMLRSPARQHLINNYLMQLFVDMALCRAGLYD